ncbi:4Fe-4S dicluster domain-containing protein [Vibrio quintilis]|uniref:6-hydroxynicotinate reductase n=1 Tax=Vibrio quintilis TaxID=1117707 RepID=A0A1M7Z2V3_9VIBR|nr:hypothetical protein [Vibrio quintilis]SHO59289.1 6-hydroxynicotinate reductase [Vibrio quintilis]
MNVIQIDKTRCSGCKSCYRACWVDVIRWDEENDCPLIAYPEDCVECGVCELSCFPQAIQVIPSFDRDWPDIYQSRYLTQSAFETGEVQ